MQQLLVLDLLVLFAQVALTLSSVKRLTAQNTELVTGGEDFIIVMKDLTATI